jgi:RHS repeat-associated protein
LVFTVVTFDRRKTFTGEQTIAMRTGSGTGTTGVNWLFGDHLGSQSVTADASGSKIAEVRYKAWGEDRYVWGTTPTSYRYTGQRSETSLSIYYYGARWYDSSLGRFLSPDTIVPEASEGVQAWDRMAYVNNNPVRYNDPSGHCIGLFLAVCIAVGSFIMDHAAVITAVALTGAVTSFLTGDTPKPELINDPVASQQAFENSLFTAGTWITGGTAALEFGSATYLAPSSADTPPTIKPGAAGGSTAGKPFPEIVRQQAFDEDPTHTCVWCGTPGTGTQVDHAIPMSLGGNATIDNAQLACPHCNASRGARAFPLTPPDGYRGAWPPPWWPNRK